MHSAGLNMKDIIIIAIVLVIAAAISIYIYKAKKRGEHCIGCPYSKQCSGKCSRDNHQ